MSFTSPPDRLTPDDPLYYAPPRLRRGPDFPSTAAPQARSDRWRPISSASRFDALLEEAVAESLALSPASEIASEPPVFAFERDQRRGFFGVAARIAAAVAASAVIASIFVVMVPTSQKDDASKLAGSEVQTIVASATVGSATAAQTSVTPEQSQALLQKFVQWQQRDSAEQQVVR